MYFKEESVQLAIDMLNEAELRLGDASTVMSVSQAQFGHKNEQGGGTVVPSGGGEQKVKKTIDKKKATKRIERMQRYVAFLSFTSYKKSSPHISFLTFCT